MSKTGLWATAGACLVAGVMVAPPPAFQAPLAMIEQAATSVQWAPPAVVAPQAPAAPIDLAPVPVPPPPEGDRQAASQQISAQLPDRGTAVRGVARQVRETTRSSSGSGQSSSTGGGNTDPGSNNGGGNTDPGAGTPAADKTPGAESVGPACAPAADGRAATGASKATECRRP